MFDDGVEWSQRHRKTGDGFEEKGRHADPRQERALTGLQRLILIVQYVTPNTELESEFCSVWLSGRRSEVRDQ